MDRRATYSQGRHEVDELVQEGELTDIESYSGFWNDGTYDLFTENGNVYEWLESDTARDLKESR